MDAGVPQETIDALDHGANTNWLKAITRTAFSQSHNVSVTGGTNGFTYNASLNYLNQEGIVINTGKTLAGIRFNAEQKALNDKLVINVSLLADEIDRKYTDYNIFEFINVTPPTFPVYDMQMVVIIIFQVITSKILLSDKCCKPIKAKNSLVAIVWPCRL